jgi:hypothetical protein
MEVEEEEEEEEEEETKERVPNPVNGCRWSA